MRQQRLEVLSKIEKVPAGFDGIKWLFYIFSIIFSPTCCVLQLFIALLEVEETARMKTPVLSEAEERRLGEKTQWKVENIYSQLQDHNPA